jgi:hypothetical protein
VLKNPGFEDGNNGWANRSCKIEAVKSPVHNGAGAVKAFGRSETWQGIKQSLLGKVLNGNTYKISAWVRLENADNDTVTISIEQADNDATQYINVNSATASKGEWTQLLGEFTLNANGTLKTLDVYIEGPAADVNFFVDDVVVYGAAPGGQADPNAPKAEADAAQQKTETDTADTFTDLAQIKKTIKTRCEAALDQKLD